MKIVLPTAIGMLICFFSLSVEAQTSAKKDEEGFEEHITQLANVKSRKSVIKLTEPEIITTATSFTPPVEIRIVAKTDSTNLRLGYAADQLIFNWERDRNQLRLNGGPADNQHKFGAGSIPVDKYVVVRWVVTPSSQSVYVDDQLRYQHFGNYGHLNRPVSVFTSYKAEVTVKSIKVKQLPADTP